ncbi:hypothetical protein P0L94_09710 [Microbacter sp. GSS18]|nr:hypothetical protein P0L94_09710 [Microbacter sp. GSS18]
MAPDRADRTGDAVGLRDVLRGADEPRVLELRVHGVNNTTAPALLDLRPEDVELVAGDKLGSFWRPKGAALDAIEQGGRGYVPKGILREAYSWGGMVRTTPNVGNVGALSILAGAAVRVVYALLLPFSIANAVHWTRRLPEAGDRRPRITAGLTRLFGLMLTLLFTSAAATVALDVGAAQCAADPAMCAPMQSVFGPLSQWQVGVRFALLGLVPAAAVGVLWLMSAVARVRYDVLPGMRRDAVSAPRAAVGRGATPTREPSALLSHPHFWSTRASRHLARVHLAAALLLTAAFLAAHAAFDWYTDCQGLGVSGACVGDAFGEPMFTAFFWLAAAALAGLAATTVLAVLLPAPGVSTPERAAASRSSVLSGSFLGGAFAVFAAVELLLAIPETPLDVGVSRLYGAGATPLVIIMVAGAIAVSGVAWRGRGSRRAAAWSGCAPAVFMTVSLTLAVAASAIATVTAGDYLNGGLGAATLVRQQGAAANGVLISSSYIAGGTAVLAGAIVAAAVAAATVLLPRRDMRPRARAWGAPAGADDEIVPVGPAVLPPSPTTLLARIRAKRVTAARLHLIEPIGAIAAVTLGLAVACSLAWTWATYAVDDNTLASVTPLPQVTANVLNLAIPTLAVVGLGLVAMLAGGSVREGTRPLGVVWDIVSYLPRAGHPFGPPPYSQRAVPEIAGRLFTWLTDRPERRAVLAAHSMGGVLAVSALGLLASSPETRPVLGRVSLLTFGVQLRPLFGRLLPELLGPQVLGTHGCRAPRLLAHDPWWDDFAAEGGEAAGAQPGADRPAGALGGALLSGCEVPWLSLWRLTDYLGFPAMSSAPAAGEGGFVNDVDRFAEELDLSGYMVEVGTHGAYYRAPAYERAVSELAGLRR